MPELLTSSPSAGWRKSCPYALMPQLLDILLDLPETIPIQEIVSFIQKVEHSYPDQLMQF